MEETKEGSQVATTGHSNLLRAGLREQGDTVLPEVKRKILPKFSLFLQFFLKGVFHIFLNLSTLFFLSYLETVASVFSKYA